MIKINGKMYKYDISTGVVKDFRGRDVKLAILLKFNPYLEVENG